MRQDIAFVRIVATVLVVFWHACGFPVIYGRLLGESNLVTSFFHFFRAVLPDNVMSVFTFIAVFLFYKQYAEGKYPCLGTLIKKKGVRLFIPYFVITPIALLTLSDDVQAFRIVLYNAGDFVTWYCIMLFWLFIFAFLAERIRFFKVFLVGASVLLLFRNRSIYNGDLPLCLDMAAFSYMYFLLGGLVYKYNDLVESFVRRYAWEIGAAYLSLFYLTIGNNGTISLYSRCALTFLLPVIMFYASRWLLNDKKMTIGKFGNSINQRSFYIYIINGWILSPLLRLPGVHQLANEHLVLFLISSFIVLFFSSYILAGLVLKIRPLRWIFGG